MSIDSCALSFGGENSFSQRAIVNVEVHSWSKCQAQANVGA